MRDIGRIFDEAKDRPLYVIRSASGFAQESDQNAPAKAKTATRK